MARKRDIDPGLWENEQLGSVSRDARLLFIACVSQADDEGRLKGSARLLKAKAFPYDDDISSIDVALWRASLADAGLIVVCQQAGFDQIEIVNFKRWLRRDRHPVRAAWESLRRKVGPRIFERDGYVCRDCGASDRPLEIDHFTPIARGGTNDDSNLRVLCKPCNRRKGAR